MTEKQRPTSPHLQIYRWNVSSLTSIMHRMTGVLLYFSILVISWYLTYYAYKLGMSDPMLEQIEECDCLINNLIRFVVSGAVVVVIFALYYHFLNGIRHLFWDFGKGFEKNLAKRNGYIVIGLAVFLSVATIIFAASASMVDATIIIVQ